MTEYQLGAFTIHELVGSGGMSRVFRGEHRATTGARTEVAVKVMRSDLGAPRSFRSNFMREVRSVARLNHPCIVKLFDAGEVGPDDMPPHHQGVESGSLYLVMELVTGGSLWSVAEDLDFMTLKGLSLDLLDALAHAHAMGIVHRDLKPANILVEETLRGPRLRLTDFGLARALDHPEPGDEPLREKRVSGTPKYMAPEQILGRWREQGPWTDLYALGVMCWHLVCGSPPFEGGSKEDVMRGHLLDSLPRFRPVMPVPPGFEAWLRKLLVKHPSGRFQRAADTAVGLLSLSSTGVFGATAGEVKARHAVGLDQDLPTLVALGADFSAELASPSEARVAGRLWPAPPMPFDWHRLTEPKAMQLDGAGLGLYGLRVVPVVARAAERSMLWSALRSVKAEKAPRAVVLRGLRGCGKTRLLDWLAVRAHELGSANVLRLRHSVRGSAADGLGPMLGGATNTWGLEHEEALVRLKNWAADRGYDPPSGDLAVLAGLVAPPSGEEQRISQREVFASLGRFVEELARKRPVVIVLDDAQWGREAVLFASYLLDQVSAPALVVAAFADTDDGVSSVTLGSATELDVPPLGEDDLEKLVASLLGLSRALARRVAQSAGGNPLYAVETVGGWVDAGLLRPMTEGFELPPGVATALPQGLAGLWSARIESVCRAYGPLEGAARGAIDVASVLGGDIDTAEWRLACRSCGFDTPPELVDRLAAATVAVDTATGWRFAHGLAGESIYETLSGRPEYLAALHAGCFRTLDFLYRGSARADDARRCAYHAAGAGDVTAAFAAYERSNALLVHSGDPVALEAVLDAQQRLLDLNGEGPASDRRRIGQVWRSRLAMYRGDFDGAIQLAERVVLDAERTSRVGAFGRRLLAMYVSNRDPERACQLYAQSAEAYGTIGDDWGRATALCSAANLLAAIGRLADARAGIDEAATIARRRNSRPIRLEVEFQRGAVARVAGDLEDALRHFNEAIGLAYEVGWRSRYADALAEHADVLRMTGDLEGAEEQLRESVEIRQALGEQEMGIVMLNVGLIAIQRGDYAGALETVAPVAIEFRAQGIGVYLQFALGVLMPAFAGCGRFEELAAVLDEYDSIALEFGVIDPDLATVCGLAGQLCEAVVRSSLAVRAYEHTIVQLLALDRPLEAKTLQARVARLQTAGGPH